MELICLLKPIYILFVPAPYLSCFVKFSMKQFINTKSQLHITGGKKANMVSQKDKRKELIKEFGTIQIGNSNYLGQKNILLWHESYELAI
jgi:hypothetical protein